MRWVNTASVEPKDAGAGLLTATARRIRRGPARIVRLPLPAAELATRLVASKSLRAGDVKAFMAIEPRQAATVPLMSASAACGFPSPADDYLDRPLDFNDLLIQNPAATFAVRIAGESMTGARWGMPSLESRGANRRARKIGADLSLGDRQAAGGTPPRDRHHRPPRVCNDESNFNRLGISLTGLRKRGPV